MRELLATAAAELETLAPWSPEPVVAAGDAKGRPIQVSDPGRSPSLRASGAHVTGFFDGGLQPGDVAISNDPFVGSSHVTDFTLVRRTRHGTVLVRMRLPDIGGFEMGGLAPQSFDTWGEGARFPALRIAVAGRARPEALALLTLNSRTPVLLRAGLDAMRATADGLAATLDAGGPLDDLPLRTAAAEARAALGALAPGTYRAEAPVESPIDGRAPVVRAELTIADGAPRLSLAGSDAQLEAPLNSPPAHTLDCCLAAIAGAVPGFPLTPGALDALAVDPGPGTITGARVPAITGLAPYLTARAIRRVVTMTLHAAGAAGADPDAWWQATGRAAYEAHVDPTTLRLAPGRARALADLERERSR
jgi:N-methylhydantoinase B/oxoprolinase/acetone carboxylase alpha subunit